MKLFLSLFFIAAGALHFLRPETYLKMMPDYLPFPSSLVFLSGVCEVLLGLCLLMKRFSRATAWGLIALLFAVFPANVHLAMHPEIFPSLPAWAFWARLPLQLVLIFWLYPYTK